MNLLSLEKREALLRSLKEAPDEILMDAVRQYKDWRKHVDDAFKEVQAFVGMKAVEGSAFKPQAAIPTQVPPPPPEKQSAAPRKDINPGKSTITKIGSETKTKLISMMKEGMQPSHDKFGEHLKLLHNRGEIKYDGATYYI